MTQADTQRPDETGETGEADELIARPDAGYRWKHMLMALLLIGGGFWFAYDGWVRWPANNDKAAKVTAQMEIAQNRQPKDSAEIEELAKELQKYEPHNYASILLQKILAFTLPAFGLFWGGWTLRETRGHYRMTGSQIELPGHPLITCDNIRRIDKRKWDRKGVAFLHYEAGSPPAPAIAKLDDFAYDRQATDAILERIEQNILPAQPAAIE